MHDIADSVEKLLSHEMEADVITHVDPVSLEGKEIAIIKDIILKNQKLFDLEESIQDLRIVKNHHVESILFQVPVLVEFNKQEKFSKKCSEELSKKYPDCKIDIEFKSQMSMR